MATRQEIIDIIDAFLEKGITLDGAIKWAQLESTRTPYCEDPPATFHKIFGLLFLMTIWEDH